MLLGGKNDIFWNPQVLPPTSDAGHEKHFLWKFYQKQSTLEPGLRAETFVITEDTGVEVPQC